MAAVAVGFAFDQGWTLAVTGSFNGYYRSFVTEEARALGITLDDLREWKPAATAAKRGRKKKEAA